MIPPSHCKLTTRSYKRTCRHCSRLYQSSLEQASTFGPFMRESVMFLEITHRATYHEVRNVIRAATRQGYNVVYMMFTPCDFLMAVVAFALLPLVLLLNLLGGVRASIATLMGASSVVNCLTMLSMDFIPLPIALGCLLFIGLVPLPIALGILLFVGLVGKFSERDNLLFVGFTILLTVFYRLFYMILIVTLVIRLSI